MAKICFELDWYRTELILKEQSLDLEVKEKWKAVANTIISTAITISRKRGTSRAFELNIIVKAIAVICIAQ